MIDSLEARRLLADFASVNAGGTLSAVGTSNNDTITIDQSGSNIVVRRGSQSLSFASSAVKRFWVNAFRGNDRVTINVARPSTIIGSSGNDTLTGGNNSDAFEPGYGNDSIDGRGGADRVSYADHEGPVTAQIILNGDGSLTGNGGQNGAGENDLFFNIEELEGTNRNDELAVRNQDTDPSPNFTQTFQLFGRGGKDLLMARTSYNQDAAQVIAFGGSGNDTFLYSGQNNQLFGESGEDFFKEERDDDAAAQINGGSGFDTQSHNRPGIARMGVAIERLIVGRANGVVGTDGNDIIQLAGITGPVFAMGGNDRVEVLPEVVDVNFAIDGGGGNDTLIGGPGNDSLSGGDGDDTFMPGNGNDSGDAGTGDFTLDYSNVAPGAFFFSQSDSAPNYSIGMKRVFSGPPTSVFTFDVSAGLPDVQIIATPGNDQIDFLNSNSDDGGAPTTIFGGGGNDDIEANSGTTGGTGARTVADGGAGNDTLTFRGENFLTTGLRGGSGNDVLRGIDIRDTTINDMEIDGGSGRDLLDLIAVGFTGFEGTFAIPNGVEDLALLTSSEQEDTASIVGNGLNNVVSVTANRITVLGIGGNDHITVNTPADGTASLDGGSGDDTLIGSAGIDRLLGAAGRDSLVGNAGDDRIFGGSGNDTLVGGAGRDLLHGQDGDDRIFALDNEIDTLDGGAGFDRAQRDNAAGIVDSVNNVEQFI